MLAQTHCWWCEERSLTLRWILSAFFLPLSFSSCLFSSFSSFFSFSHSLLILHHVVISFILFYFVFVFTLIFTVFALWLVFEFDICRMRASFVSGVLSVRTAFPEVLIDPWGPTVWALLSVRWCVMLVFMFLSIPVLLLWPRCLQRQERKLVSFPQLQMQRNVI